MEHPTLDWQKLESRFYRKTVVYNSMLWDPLLVDLSYIILVGCRFGGPLAIIRDSSKMVPIHGSNPTKPMMSIYTSSGKLLSRFMWDSQLVSFGWTDDEQLICVLTDGTVRLYSIYGVLNAQHSMGRECSNVGVLNCRIWENGIVCVTASFQFFVMTDLTSKQPIVYPLVDPMLQDPPTSWAFIKPEVSPDKKLKVLVAAKSGTILVIDDKTRKDQLLSKGPFHRMTVSPNGQLVACYQANGNVWVVKTSDFARSVFELTTGRTNTPNSLLWCDNETVVLYWENLKSMLVGRLGYYIEYEFDSPVALVPDYDGIRIISQEACEFLQRVPKFTEDIFKIGSTSSSALLYDAREHFDSKNPKADENIRSITKAELHQAVRNCTIAASEQWSPSLQKALLKSASFGKCFLESYPADEFVWICKYLRVINAVRDPSIGYPITYLQLKEMGIDSLIDRLVSHNFHLMALRLCDYLRRKTDRILVNWACAKVKGNADSHETLRVIVEKLNNLPGVSYANIAATAMEQKRYDLAAMLLDYEPKVANQLPLLIDMKQYELALNKAVESGDTDMVQLSLKYLRENGGPDFIRVIKSKPAAQDIYLSSLIQREDWASLRDFYQKQPDLFNAGKFQAAISLQKPFAGKDMKDCLDGLDVAKNMFRDAKDLFALKCTEEQALLLANQKKYENLLDVPLLYTSLSETLRRMLAQNHLKNANELRNEFKVPDKRFWWIRMRVLAERNNWDGLMALSKEKKPPVTFNAFAEICIDFNNVTEAGKYIARIPDPHQRLQLFLRAGLYIPAADVAGRELKDVQSLQSVRSKIPPSNREALAHIEQYLPK
eukprot:TRINITY_DN9791_c0_g1_i1.p1 TRINITY_DN9791_c0_g1~~TRINITY_DN9791_c0_g1_i1.p1  ORF type:complete len:831 (-),score=151.81 TRINITY_DN9791_c0_g1_i1:20-2512(-)